MSTEVFLGLGSNLEREQHLCAALDRLQVEFGPLDCSPVFESEPVGIRSGCFLNMVVRMRTDCGLRQLLATLKAIEAAEGRTRAAPRQLPLDVDVLLYGDLQGVHDDYLLPRPGMTASAHILWPLAVLAPEGSMPGSSETFADLWNEARVTHDLWPYPLEWQGRTLTPVAMLEQAAVCTDSLQTVVD